MEEFWARIIEPSGKPGPNYWEYYAEKLAQIARIPEAVKTLDIGTYDGNVLFKAMKKVTHRGFGVGADIYYGGFQEGIMEAKRGGWEGNTAFIQMDANALGFHPEVFHTVLANFVGWDECFDFESMEFIKPDKMMAEIMRVLRPGGQVGIGSWVEQCDIDWVEEAFKKYYPEIKTNVPSYGRENPEGYKIILQNSGFEDIQVYIDTTNFVLPDAEIWWRQMKQATSDYFRQITEPDTLESFKEQVIFDLQEFQYPEGIRFSKTVSFVYGTKPG